MRKLGENYSKTKLTALIIILLGSILRIFTCVIHFTHVDDVGTASYLLYLRTMTDNFFLQVKYFVQDWTYAPLQFIFTNLLISPKYSYMTNIILGRIPSLVCGIAAMIVLWLLVKPDKEKDRWEGIAALVLLAFSWQNIIYSAQMESYSIGVLGALVVIYFLSYDYERGFKNSAFMCVALTLVCYAQYQLFIVVFCCYAAIFLVKALDKNWKGTFKICCIGICNFLLSLPLLLFMVNHGKFGKALNWNVGLGEIFRFHYTGDGPVGFILYFFSFFIKNIYLCFKYFFVSELPIAGVTVTIILLLIAAAGVVWVHKERGLLRFALFSDGLAVIVILMVMKNSLTLGPSRHSMFLFPVWLMIVYYGTLSLYRFLNEKKVKILAAAVSGVVILSFVATAPGEFADRYNHISDSMLKDIVVEYDPEIMVAYAYTNDLYLMDFDGYTNISDGAGNGVVYKKGMETRELGPGGRIVLFSRSRDLDSYVDTYAEQCTKKYKENFTEQTSDRLTTLKDCRVIDRIEIESGKEVDYASRYFENFKNGLYLYVLEVE